jgi:autotransporter family porin
VATSRIDFSADASTLRGDVVVDSATAEVHMVLGNGTTFSGALRNDSGYQVAQLALDGSSQWNVRASSSVGTLEHAGTIAFDAPAAGDSRPLPSAATTWATVASGSSTARWATTLRWATSW